MDTLWILERQQDDGTYIPAQIVNDLEKKKITVKGWETICGDNRLDLENLSH